MITKEQFESKINKIENGCWIWNDARSGEYGWYSEERILAHRVSAYLYLNFNLNSKALICHKRECNNKMCVNPEHLYVGNYSTNAIDTIMSGKHNMRSKTHCPKGHPYDETNTKIYEHRRYCKKCSNTKIKVILKDGKIKWVRNREFEILQRNNLLL